MSRQVVLVTGASRGIGRAIAVRFADSITILALFGRDGVQLAETEKLVQDAGASTVSFLGDVGDKGFVNEAVQEIKKKFGKIDVLVNNAGAAVFHKFVNTTLDEFKLQINANVYGVFNFTRAVIDDMIANNSGTIINIASIAGKNGFVGGTTYSATKHAVMGFTKSLLLEVRKHNIRIAAVCPGSVHTEMIVGSEVHPKNIDKVLKPEDIAETVFLITKLPPSALINELEIRPTNP